MGTDAAAVGALGEVGGAFFAAAAFDGAGGIDLAFQFAPENREGGAGVGCEVVAFAAAVIGEESEAAVVESFEEESAGGRLA